MALSEEQNKIELELLRRYEARLEENRNEPDWYDEEDDDDTQHCSACDGHPACQDFGCAKKLGVNFETY